MYGFLTIVGYILSTVFLFSGGAAAWKRIDNARGWGNDEAMIFVFAAIAAVVCSAAYFIHMHDSTIPFLVLLSTILAAPAGFLLVFTAVYSFAATAWGLRVFFKGLWAAIDWAAGAGQKSRDKTAGANNKSSDSSSKGAVPPPPPVKRDSIFPDGF